MIAALAGCAVTEARMQLPHGLGPRTTQIELTGVGGGQAGSFRLGGSEGTFSRRADRLGVFDPLIVRRTGEVEFSVSGPEFTGRLSGECSYRQLTSSSGAITVTPQRLRHVCRFRRDGAPLAAEFELLDADGVLGSRDGREARRGRLMFEGRHLTFRSAHAVEGALLPLATPIGYTIEADGETVGAIELNGAVKTLRVPLEPALREPMLTASLALALVWDPAVLDEG